jgi:tRNA pseudouridine synthase 10
MCKFHASGREDMDVRMLLPEANASDTSNRLASGRPFVCEVIDALRLPSVTDLLRIVDNVNKTTSVNENMTLPRCYGRNDMTSISRDFSFAPASSFKNLQAETEDKVKFYGCLCWSATPLPKEDEDLKKLLGTFPLQLKQRTPIRVLHRRSNMIRVRHVLSAQAHRIDDHYFRLHISTDAGTCESFEKARSLVFWNLLTNRTFSVLQT